MELKLTVVLPNTDWLRKNPDRLIIVVVFILFLWKGELSVNIGREHNIHLLEHNMLLIPQHEDNRVEGIVSAECLLLFWNKQITACDKMYFESISHVKWRIAIIVFYQSLESSVTYFEAVTFLSGYRIAM